MPTHGRGDGDRGDRGQQMKMRGIVLASAGYALAAGVLLVLHLSGVERIASFHWLLLASATAVSQSLLWLIAHKGWDKHVPWDPHFVYVPMGTAAILLNLYTYVAPAASSILLMTWFIVLLFAVGLIGGPGVVATSAVMAVGRMLVDVLLLQEGAALSVPFEATMIAMFSILNLYVGVVFDRLRREREERKVLLRERAVALERMQRSEARYRTLVENVPIGMYRTTPQGRNLDGNPALVRMLGYQDLESLQRAEVESFYADPADRRRWQELMARDGIVQAYEARARRADGSVFWVRDSARAVHGADGKVLYYEGTWEDITERREAEQAVLETNAMLAARVAELEQLRETLRQQSIRDSLTGLFNRRYLEETLDREIHRVIRKGAPLGVIMVDLDHFKQFNDLYGHEAGDTLLRELGRFLQNNIRAEDIPCRYGGEEFTLILPEAPLDVTRRRAEHLREHVKQLHVLYRGQALGGIRLSCGVAAYPDHGDTGDVLLRAADAALYRAKAEGRDRVVVANLQPAQG